MLMKTFFRIAVALLLAVPVGSAYADGISELLLTTRSGKAASFSLDSRPKVTMTATDVVLAFDGMEVRYPLKDFVRFCFLGDEVGVADIRKDAVRYSVTPSEVKAEGMNAGDRLAVYTQGGVLLASATSAADGRASVSVSGLPKGVYIVKAGDKSFKIQK